MPGIWIETWLVGRVVTLAREHVTYKISDIQEGLSS